MYSSYVATEAKAHFNAPSKIARKHVHRLRLSRVA